MAVITRSSPSMEHQASAAQLSQEVTGRSAFWILATLASVVVMQPLPGSRRILRDLFEDNIDLLRCVPGVCIYDAIIDLYVLGRAIRRKTSGPLRPIQIWRITLPKASSITVKLALLIFASLPQALKVFSMRGIPATQFTASVFLFAAITRLAIQLSGLDTDDQYPDTRKHGVDSLLVIFFIIPLCLAQGIFTFLIWHRINLSVAMHLPPDLEEPSLWLRLGCVLAVSIQFIIWIMNFLVRWCLNNSTAPHIFPVRGLYFLFMALGPTAKPSKAVFDATSSLEQSIVYAASFVFSIGLLCVIFGRVLESLGRLVQQRAGETPTTNATYTNPPASSLSRQENDAFKWPVPRRPVAFSQFSLNSLSRIGFYIDSWLLYLIQPRSAVCVIIATTTFNIFITACYYFVCFDGTGTTNPEWTSILGKN